MGNEKTNVFISFSFDSSNNRKERYEKILEESDYAVNFSEKEDKSHLSDETIWEGLKNRISGSSVMIVIYSRDFERFRGGKALKEKDNVKAWDSSFNKQGWIYKELRCALRHSENNHMNGILVVMPDDIYSSMLVEGKCNKDGKTIHTLNRGIYPEILANNFANKISSKRTPTCGCCLSILYDSYIPIIKESVFLSNPSHYINIVKEKRHNENDYEIKKETN